MNPQPPMPLEFQSMPPPHPLLLWNSRWKKGQSGTPDCGRYSDWSILRGVINTRSMVAIAGIEVNK